MFNRLIRIFKTWIKKCFIFEKEKKCCEKCGAPIFNFKKEYAKHNLCVYCWERKQYKQWVRTGN